MTRSAIESHASTDRRVIAGEAYGTGTHLAARQRLYQAQRPRHDLPAIAATHLADVTGTVADIGCGNGWYLRHLRQHRPDLTVVGVDLSAGILANLRPPLVVADAQALPFASGSFQAVLAMHMLYHLPDSDAGLRELTRVLTSGGTLIVSTNARADKRELDQLWSQAAADVLGTPEGPHRISLSDRFPLDDAPAHLAQHFDDVRLVDLRGVISVTEPAPVIAHFASYQAWAADSGVPFIATLARAEQRLTETIERDGAFTITCQSGMLICRAPAEPRQ
ncbi:MAG: class I SAM-dependent methyltransferase [Dactylosporangium sp.]|nr:class I SAM-dependent methyltransferase [Dactylosporangium sp.]NNJ62154.1 class I SAM-dependent methyltransferase [Dactylosporangium sp.]